eukprot:jgi/Phyca11/112700/e_gw1.22.307.1
MYRSHLDPSNALEFAFDPIRALHAHEDSRLQWPEYPYKQVTIDRVRAKAGRAYTTEVGWKALERRFLAERTAFQQAKRDFIRREKDKVVAVLDAQAARERQEEERKELSAWRARQIVKRYEDGSKYDGDGVKENGVLIPHGYGTLWVPEEKYANTVGRSADIKRVVRYVGEWRDGFMHGNGTFHWASGESWEGNFIRNEMQGKGIYTSSERDPDELNSDTGSGANRAKDPQILRPNQRIRYFDASQHVCWGDELILGCRVRLFGNRHFGDPLVSVVKRYNVDLEEETETVVVRYDPKTDRHLLRKGETEETRWMSLSNTNFRVLASHPVARLLEE